MSGAEPPRARERQAKDAVAARRAENVYRAFFEPTAIEGNWKIGEGAASELLTWANKFHDLVVIEQTDNVADEIGFDVAEQCALGDTRCLWCHIEAIFRPWAAHPFRLEWQPRSGAGRPRCASVH